jgi:hypothetical protein
VKAYKQLAPPSIALAMMSWERALVLSELPFTTAMPAAGCKCEPCVMHYAMLDRITVGGAP